MSFAPKTEIMICPLLSYHLTILYKIFYCCIRTRPDDSRESQMTLIGLHAARQGRFKVYHNTVVVMIGGLCLLACLQPTWLRQTEASALDDTDSIRVQRRTTESTVEKRKMQSKQACHLDFTHWTGRRKTDFIEVEPPPHNNNRVECDPAERFKFHVILWTVD